MLTDLCKGVFNQILLKTTENDQKFQWMSKFQNDYETFRKIFRFMYFSEK